MRFGITLSTLPVMAGLILSCNRDETTTEMKSNQDEWPFDQAPNVAAVSTRQVMREGMPILSVVHYSDDHSWAFLCGTTGDSADSMVVGMGSVIELDPSLKNISDLEPGWTAERDSIDAEWVRKFDPDY